MDANMPIDLAKLEAIDWQRILLDLGRKESTHTTARHLNLSEVHLRRIKRGEVNEPRFNSGIRLLYRHRQLVGGQFAGYGEARTAPVAADGAVRYHSPRPTALAKLSNRTRP